MLFFFSSLGYGSIEQEVFYTDDHDIQHGTEGSLNERPPLYSSIQETLPGKLALPTLPFGKTGRASNLALMHNTLCPTHEDIRLPRQRETPISPPLALLEMLNINMIESLIQRRRPAILKSNSPVTKPTPKLQLFSQIETAGVEKMLCSVFRGAVLLTQMMDVGFLPVEDLPARDVFDGVAGATEPAGDVEVLGALVTFPVGLAPEGLGAVRECTAVRPFVALLVFSVESLLARAGRMVLRDQWLTSSRSAVGCAWNRCRIGTSPVSRRWGLVQLRGYHQIAGPGLLREPSAASGAGAGRVGSSQVRARFLHHYADWIFVRDCSSSLSWR